MRAHLRCAKTGIGIPATVAGQQILNLLPATHKISQGLVGLDLRRLLLQVFSQLMPDEQRKQKRPEAMHTIRVGAAASRLASVPGKSPSLAPEWQPQVYPKFT